jgi:hypothetical protein
VTALPLWAQSPYLLRWMKLLLETGLAADGPDAEDLLVASPFVPVPDPLPTDDRVIAWARLQIRQELRP